MDYDGESKTEVLRSKGSGSVQVRREKVPEPDPKKGSGFGLGPEPDPGSGSGFRKSGLRTGPNRTPASLFAKVYLDPSLPSHSMYNHSTLMRSHSTTTSTLSLHNAQAARLIIPTASRTASYRLHASNLVSPLPFLIVNACESSLYLLGSS